MSNYSILEQNTLDGLSETAQVLYLKLLDVFQKDEKRAFLAACKYEDEVGGVLDFILENMPNKPSLKVKTELSTFLSERYRHNFMEKFV